MSREFCSVKYRDQIKNGYASHSASKGKNPLVRLIANDDWANALRQIDGSHAKKWSVSPSMSSGNVYATHDSTIPHTVDGVGCTSFKFSASMKVNGGQQQQILPIHQACSRPTVQVPFLESLVDAYPGSLRMCDSTTMRTPLHLALISGASDDVVLYLIEKYGGVASVQDYRGRVPLHYACLGPDVSPLVIERLASAAPETVRATDDLEWTPLHMITVYSRSTEAIDLMLGLCPEAILMVTRKGETVLDLVKFNKSRSKDSVMAHLVSEERKFQENDDYRHSVDAYLRPFDECSLPDDCDFV